MAKQDGNDFYWRWNSVSRRRFLRMLSAGGAGLVARSPKISWAATEGLRSSFEEIPSSASGISWVHTSGRSPMAHLPETVGAGCAFLDYDNDGWMDIYLINSGPCDFYSPPQPLRNALYRNNRDGTFSDVTLKAGVTGNAYGMGIAVADYDRDGFPDLYVTQYPHSILYHNNGDGTFTDVTAKAGVAAPGWATSAVWFDYDNDGLLDLFVCRFVDYSKDKLKFCGDKTRHFATGRLGMNRPCLPCGASWRTVARGRDWDGHGGGVKRRMWGDARRSGALVACSRGRLYSATSRKRSSEIPHSGLVASFASASSILPRRNELRRFSPVSGLGPSTSSQDFKAPSQTFFACGKSL